MSSNTSLPDSFWEQVNEDMKKERHKCSGCDIVHDRGQPPRAWDKVIRPQIAHLFKSGIVGPGYWPDPTGHSIVARQPGYEQASWHIDYRDLSTDWDKMMAGIRNPAAIDLLAVAQRYSTRNAGARFALLRLWTHTHLYPLMLGDKNREYFSFGDGIEGSWEWKFVPKHMPRSEWSMQHSIDLLLERIKRKYGRHFAVKRDMVLVMGESEASLRENLTVVAFQLQTKPWRQEIDWWKSFVNVDLAWLENLDKKWLV